MSADLYFGIIGVSMVLSTLALISGAISLIKLVKMKFQVENNFPINIANNIDVDKFYELMQRLNKE
jgi:hypothetical protein